MSSLKGQILACLRDVALFSQAASGVRLRRYQCEVARSVVQSVLQDLGLSFVVVFPRQSGKNELQAQIEAYLLTLLSKTPAELVKVSPTWKPQSQNAMRRLERVLKRNLLLEGRWRRESGYIYRVGEARLTFLSGAPGANIVGATASTLLECDEAQDVLPAKWDKDIAPMAASTNATRVFWGTAWSARTLLAREARLAREAEQQDGRRRVWVLSAEAVAREVPAYGRFVEEQVRRLGRQHPLVRTQFFSEEVDEEGGMFPPARLERMRGGHPRQSGPAGQGGVYALLVDVAGEDEAAAQGEVPAAELRSPGRDSTALTVVACDLSTLEDPLLQAPTYRVLDRRLWTGVRHTALYGQLKALAELWRARWLVIDATGVGAGLASFLGRALPGRVLPFTFNLASKSRLGWSFLSIVETGRYREYAPEDAAQALFWGQARACRMEIRPGPERRVSWGVPGGTRDPLSGEPVFDDLLLSAALCAVLEEQAWNLPGSAAIVPGRDPLEEMDEGGY